MDGSLQLLQTTSVGLICGRPMFESDSCPSFIPLPFSPIMSCLYRPILKTHFHHPQSQLEKLLHYVTCSSHQYDKYWKCMVVEAFLGSGTVFPHPATWEASLGLWKVLRSPHLSLCSSPALSQHWEAWGTLRSQITGHYTYTGEATKAPDNRATEWRYSKALFEMEESNMQRERERRLPFRGLPDWPANCEPFKHLSAILTRLRPPKRYDEMFDFWLNFGHRWPD